MQVVISISPAVTYIHVRQGGHPANQVRAFAPVSRPTSRHWRAVVEEVVLRPIGVVPSEAAAERIGRDERGALRHRRRDISALVLGGRHEERIAGIERCEVVEVPCFFCMQVLVSLKFFYT